MKYTVPFPKGHDPNLEQDKKIVSKGILDKSTKGKEIIVKGFKEEDIREIREMLIEEIKRQKKEENEGVKNESSN